MPYYILSTHPDIFIRLVDLNSLCTLCLIKEIFNLRLDVVNILFQSTIEIPCAHYVLVREILNLRLDVVILFQSTIEIPCAQYVLVREIFNLMSDVVNIFFQSTGTLKLTLFDSYGFF